jgi:hypothetical protein
MWYSNVLIELFQVGVSLSQQHAKPANDFWEHQIEEYLLWKFLLQHKGVNLLINMFSVSGLLIFYLFFFSRSRLWSCGSSCRGGVTRKGALCLNYFAFMQSLTPLYQYCNSEEKLKEKKVMNFINISENQFGAKMSLLNCSTLRITL